MRRRSCTISAMRVAGTCRSSASLLTVRWSGFIKSSRRISPGWTGGISDRGLRICGSLLVIVDNFHFMEMAIALNETDWPLIVDANRVLALPVAPYRFQLISWRGSHDGQIRRCVHLEQLAQSAPLEGTDGLAGPRM